MIKPDEFEQLLETMINNGATINDKYDQMTLAQYIVFRGTAEQMEIVLRKYPEVDLSRI